MYCKGAVDKKADKISAGYKYVNLAQIPCADFGLFHTLTCRHPCMAWKATLFTSLLLEGMLGGSVKFEASFLFEYLKKIIVEIV